MRYGKLVGFCVLGMLLLAQLSSRGEESLADDDEAMVDITKDEFKPKDVTVKEKGKVTWLNKRKDKATVVGKGWQVGPIDPGKKGERKFDKEGDYPYHLKEDDKLKGTVKVKK